MDFPALVGSASTVVDSGTKKAGCRPGRNVYRAIYTIMAKITSAHTVRFLHFGTGFNIFVEMVPSAPRKAGTNFTD